MESYEQRDNVKYKLTQQMRNTSFVSLDFCPLSDESNLRVVGAKAKWRASDMTKSEVVIMEKSSIEEEFTVAARVPCELTPTKVGVGPAGGDEQKTLVLASSDTLRLYQYDCESNALVAKNEYVSPKKKTSRRSLVQSPSPAPITSFDWNRINPSLAVVSCVDTTCSVWNLETGQLNAQLIAHDKDVYDVSWVRGTNVFASAGADGSVRLFDLRALDHSTIAYETPSSITAYSYLSREPELGPASQSNNLTWNNPPLLRLSWNKVDPNYAATFCLQSRKIILLDIRVPTLPVAELLGHSDCVTGISWSPTSATHLYSVGYDGNCLLWDLSGNSPASVDQRNHLAGQNQEAPEHRKSGSHQGHHSHNFSLIKGAALPAMGMTLERPVESFAVHRLHPKHVLLSSEDSLTLSTFSV